MNNIFRKVSPISINIRNIRRFSISPTLDTNYSCKLLVIGGGSGGCTMAARFSKKLKKDSVIVLEPNFDHYYQPLWTLVGAGIMPVSASRRSEASVLPAAARWIQDSAACIYPDHNKVVTTEGHVIDYEYLIVAVGFVNNYGVIPGLTEALEDRHSGVSTIYSWKYCEKTWADLKRFKGGEAIFTYPDSPIKCPGAPQKIAYLADSYLNKVGVRGRSSITFNTAGSVIFGVKKYADALTKVARRKNIRVNFTTVLREVRPDTREAVFSSPDNAEGTVVPYDMLHVAPPMRTPDVLQSNAALVDSCGFLNVDKYTLQHVTYPNIYGLGDCTSTPNSKTAAAVTIQSGIIEKNLTSTMNGECPTHRYDGYGACPLVTSYHTCIIAEFLYDGVPHETLPLDQSRESVIAFYMKKNLFPFLYWNYLLKGNYNGPAFIRRIINPFAK